MVLSINVFSRQKKKVFRYLFLSIQPKRRRKKASKRAGTRESVRESGGLRHLADLDRLWARFERDGSLRDYLRYDEAVKKAYKMGILPKKG